MRLQPQGDPGQNRRPEAGQPRRGAGPGLAEAGPQRGPPQQLPVRHEQGQGHRQEALQAGRHGQGLGHPGPNGEVCATISLCFLCLT